MNPWLIIAALILAVGAGVQGYRMGRTDNEAAHTAALAEAQADALAEARAATAAETKRLIAAAARAAEARALEDQAYADAPTVSECLPHARRLRLQTLIDAANRAAAGQP